MPQRPDSPIRCYSWYVDGFHYTKGFQCPASMPGSEQSRELNRQFHEWLEQQHPGAFAAGRVIHIRFSDYIE
jgi:hypothetical protein